MTISKSESQTQEIARNLATKITKGGVICLFGELGSGKTTFTKALAASLGIEEFEVKSPTYTYIRIYNSRPQFHHIDLYRLEGPDELLLQEIQELTHDKQNIVVIEWADRFSQYLPEKRIDVVFKYLDEKSREISVKDLR